MNRQSNAGGAREKDGQAASFYLLGRLLMGTAPGPDVDWQAVVGMARRHGLSVALFWSLKGQGDRAGRGQGWVPEALWDELQRDFYSSVAWSLRVEQQLAAVLKVLNESQVPAMVVKGPAVGSYYPDSALRPFTDFDLLIPDGQLDRAIEALKGLEYRSHTEKDWWEDQHFHLPPLVKEGSLAVEVHWRLDSDGRRGRLPSEALWSRAEPWSAGGQPALRLDAVDAVLHLCYHAVIQHKAHLGLRPLYDVAQITKVWSSAQWETLGRRAREYDLARPVFLILVLMSQVLDLEVPAGILPSLYPPGSAALPDNLVEMSLSLEFDPEARVPMAVVQAAAEEGALGRARHFLWHLFLPRAGMALVYNVPADSPRIWLTYLRRPVDLLRRYGRSALGALGGKDSAQAAWGREMWLERWLTEGEAGSE